MSLGEESFKDLFGALPPGARHAISFGFCTALLVVAFFLFVRNPLEAATSTDVQQNHRLDAHEQRLDRITDALTGVAQTQAVQGGALANIQQNQNRTDQILNRIEDKIDRLRQGR